MQITVTGRHMVVTDAIRDYATEKIGKVGKIVDKDPMTAEVVLHVEKNPAIANRDVAEVTVFMKGTVVRAEEASTDMYAAIDLASEKLERQLRKYKTKLVDRRLDPKPVVRTAPGDSELSAPEEEGEVVRTKRVDVVPMTEDEAILQLELLGHDFFVFADDETRDINVLYRRDDGDYGILQPRLS